jgi:Salmonella virulence plasmid 65kDa B protein
MRQHTVVKAFFCAIICATISSLHRFTSTFGLASVASLAAVTALLASPSAQAQYSATPTSFSVTDAGASSLSIPIYTPPMPGGIDVKLSLQYNSQASNGVFGVGWNLSGVSSITRCPKTIAEEGERIGVKNDATDVFCLDGQKLRAVAGVYGAAGTEYRTAIDSYSQIISNGNHWGGPLGFTVKTKSGAIMEFGGLDGAGALHNSNLPHPSKNLTRVWMLKSIKDRTNNTISFTYTTDPTLGEQRLLFVEFNNNGYLFVDYQDRGPSDAILKYDDGVQMGSTIKRASKIIINDYPVAANGSRPARPFKEYRLNYSQSTTTQRSLLSSVQECANDGACLPAVTMDYNSAGQVAFRPDATLPEMPQYHLVDNEGNGKPQLAFLAAYAFGETRNLPFQLPFNTNVQRGIATYDLDNDGKTDYIIYETMDIGNHQQRFTNYEWLSSTRQLTTSRSVDGGEFEIPHVYFGNRCYVDWQGDGIADTHLIMPVKASDRPAYYFQSCQAVDANGDGKGELMLGRSIGPNAALDRSKYLYKAGSSQLFNINGFGNPYGGTSEYIGDFNGDGKTDIFYTEGAVFGSSVIATRAKLAYFTSDLVN